MVDEVANLPNAFGPFCAGFLQAYLDRVRDLTGASGEAALHDPCAVLAVTHPELFEFGRHAVRIELDGRYTRGMTVIDQRLPDTGTVEVAWGVDAPAVLALIAQAVASA